MKKLWWIALLSSFTMLARGGTNLPAPSSLSVVVDTNMIVVGPTNLAAFLAANGITSAADTNTLWGMVLVAIDGATNGAVGISTNMAWIAYTNDLAQRNYVTATALGVATNAAVVAADVLAAARDVASSNAVLGVVDARGFLTAEADTNALAQLVVETNRAIQAEGVLNTGKQDAAANLDEWSGVGTGEYVRADGAVPMTGDLDMGGNSVTNIGTNSLEFVGGLRLGVRGSNYTEFVWVDPTGGVHEVADNSNLVSAAAAASAAQSTADFANVLADDAYDWADINERRIVAMWAGTYGYQHDLPGGFWLSGTNAADFDLSVSSNYTVSTSGTAWAGPVASPTPSALYTLNDTAVSTNVVDSSGNGHNGWATNTTDLMTTAGKIGTCLNFERANHEAVETAWQPATGTNCWSVACWFKTLEASGDCTLWAFGSRAWDNTEMLVSLLYDTPDVIGVGYVAGWSLQYDSGTANDGNWHHCATTFDGQTLRLFYDGVDVANAAHTANIATGGFRLGVNHDSWPTWDGDIDAVWVFTHPLTTNEVLALWNDGAGTETTEPTGGNMLIRSTNAWWSTESYTQTQGRVVLLVDDPDQDTGINTDLKARVSWDNGGNWDQVSLVSETLWPSDTMIYSASTNWSGPGTQGVIEVTVETTNGCDGTISGMGVFSRE